MKKPRFVTGIMMPPPGADGRKPAPVANLRPIANPAATVSALAEAIIAVPHGSERSRRGLRAEQNAMLECMREMLPAMPTRSLLRQRTGLTDAGLSQLLRTARWSGLVEPSRLTLTASAMQMLEARTSPPEDDSPRSHNQSGATLAGTGEDSPVPVPFTSSDSALIAPSAARPAGSIVLSPVAAAVPASKSFSRQSQAPRTGFVKGVPTWTERRHRFDAAVRFLRSKCILVSLADRSSYVPMYRVSGKRHLKIAEEVIEIAIAQGWNE